MDNSINKDENINSINEPLSKYFKFFYFIKKIQNLIIKKFKKSIHKKK